MPVDNVQRCYGRKKNVQEKSFIKNFFDGNSSSAFTYTNHGNVCERNSSSSSSSFIDQSVEEKSEEDVVIFKSPPLFNSSNEDSDKDNTSQQMKISKTNKSVKAKRVCKRRQPIKGKGYNKKKIKGIQHLSTKFCKSQQPCWSEFDNFKFTIEKPNDLRTYQRKNIIVQDITSENSDSEQEHTEQKFDEFKIDNIENKKMQQNHIFSRNKKHQSVNNFLSTTDYNSSGELFLPTPIKKKSLKGKSLQKKIIVGNEKSKKEMTKLRTNYDSCKKLNSSVLKSIENITDFQNSCKQIEIQKPLLNSSSDSIVLLGQEEISCLYAEPSSTVSKDLPCQENKAVTTVTTRSFSDNLKKMNPEIGISNNYQNDSDENFRIFLTSLCHSTKIGENNEQSKKINSSGFKNTGNISNFKNSVEQTNIQKSLRLLHHHSEKVQSNHCHSNDFLEENCAELQLDMEVQDNDQNDSRIFSRKDLHQNEVESTEKVFHADDKKNYNQSPEMLHNKNLSFAESGHSTEFSSAHEKMSISHEEYDQISNKNSLALRKRKFTKSKIDLLNEIVNCKTKAQGKGFSQDKINVTRDSNFGSCSPNVSNISKSGTLDFLKKQGKFITSTPMMKNNTSLHHSTKIGENNDQSKKVNSSGFKNTGNISNFKNSLAQTKIQKSLSKLLASSEPKEISYLNTENSSVLSNNVSCQEKEVLKVNKRCFSKNLKNSHSKIGISDDNHSIMDEVRILHQHSEKAQSNNCHPNDFLEENCAELQLDMEVQDNEQNDSRIFSRKDLHQNEVGSTGEKVFHANDKKNYNQSPEMLHNKNLSFAESGHSTEFSSAHEKMSISHEECDQISNKNNLALRKRTFFKSKIDLLNERVNCKTKAQDKDFIQDKINVCRDSNFVSCSPNVSHISKSGALDFLKKQGKFITSTPMMKNKNVNCINADLLDLLDNENNLDVYVNLSDSEKKKNCSSKNPGIQSILMTNSLVALKSAMALKSQSSLDVSEGRSPHQRALSRSLINLTPSKNVSNFLGQSNDITKTKLLELCNQDSVIAFADIYDWKKLKIKKIGEGTYGEVFMISKGKKSSVLKIIAVSEDSNIKNLQGISSVYSEIKVTACLSGLRNNKVNQSKNYVKVERASIVCGSYPSELLAAWDNFSDTKSSYNDRPDTYGNSQLFAILELQFGGKDMSCFALRNAVEAESILKQIAVSLAVAEEAFLFEHRDLHLGNILIQRNNRKNMSYKLRGKDISFECHGLQVTIIDFTLSLLHENGYVYYNDIADDVSLFEQSGDYQFEVYKLMKKHLENKWQECSLYSNILWLKYLCRKMKESKYIRASTAAHKKGLKAIDFFENKLTDCNCASECLFKWGITNTAYEKDSLHLNRTRNSILVSRSSMQKSK